MRLTYRTFALLVLLAAVPAQAFAQPLKADPAIEMVIATKGISKGVAQTDGVQVVTRAELNLGRFFVSGLAKNLASSVAEAEAQIGGGLRFKFAGFDSTASATYKAWIDPRGNPDSMAAEFGLSASRSLGRLTPRVQLVFSPDDLGSSEQSWFAEAGLGWKLSPALQLSANVGRRERGNGFDYTAANLGLAYVVNRNLTADVRVYDTNKSRSGGENFEPRAVASVRAKF